MVFPLTTPTFIGESSSLAMSDGSVLVVERSVLGPLSLGPALVWLGSLLAAGVVGHRLAART